MITTDIIPLEFEPVDFWRVTCPHCGGVLDEFSRFPRPWTPNWITRVEDLQVNLDAAEAVLTFGCCPDCGTHLAANEIGQWSAKSPQWTPGDGGILRQERALFGAGFTTWLRVVGVTGSRLIYRHRFLPITEENLPEDWARLQQILPRLPSPDDDPAFDDLFPVARVQ